jgi:Ran GTPase-activating protein (RanGAP) involved in mRNA processing and transport
MFQVGVKGAERLANSFLAGALSLSTVRLAQNGLSDQAGSYIASALADNTTITHLDLSGNTLGLVTCRVLIESFKCNTVLKTLLLDKNPLGYVEVSTLVQGLYKSTAIEHMSLSSAGTACIPVQPYDEVRLYHLTPPNVS